MVERRRPRRDQIAAMRRDPGAQFRLGLCIEPAAVQRAADAGQDSLARLAHLAAPPLCRSAQRL